MSVTASSPDTSILLVDDHDGSLLALDAVLAPLGYRLVQATSGDEALRLILQHDFAVILLDVMMPGLDGFQTASIIRSRKRSRVTPIIFVSAMTRAPGDLIESYTDGAVDYVAKPYDPAALRIKVEQFIELYRTSGTSAPRSRVLVVEDDDATATLVKAGLEARGFEVAVAHNGPVALQVAKAFRPQICLLDIHLPVMNGYQLAGRLRDLFEREAREVAFIAITGDAEADGQVAQAAGFVRQFVKPVRPSTLADLIESLLAPTC